MQRVISMHYTLTDPKGVTLDSSIGGEPLTYMEEAGQIIPGLESEVKKLKKGDKKKIDVAPEQAYGLRNEQLMVPVPREQFPKQDIKVGDQFMAGQEQASQPVRVAAVSDTHVTIDANHPLAGVPLTFDIELIDVREATAEELSHGHVHGAGGHHH